MSAPPHDDQIRVTAGFDQPLPGMITDEMGHDVLRDGRTERFFHGLLEDLPCGFLEACDSHGKVSLIDTGILPEGRSNHLSTQGRSQPLGLTEGSD